MDGSACGRDRCTTALLLTWSSAVWWCRARVSMFYSVTVSVCKIFRKKVVNAFPWNFSKRFVLLPKTTTYFLHLWDGQWSQNSGFCTKFLTFALISTTNLAKKSERHWYLSWAPWTVLEYKNFGEPRMPHNPDTCLYNITTSFLPPGLPLWTIARTVSSELLGFCFLVFPYLVRFCAVQ